MHSTRSGGWTPFAAAGATMLISRTMGPTSATPESHKAIFYLGEASQTMAAKLLVVGRASLTKRIECSAWRSQCGAKQSEQYAVLRARCWSNGNCVRMTGSVGDGMAAAAAFVVPCGVATLRVPLRPRVVVCARQAGTEARGHAQQGGLSVPLPIPACCLSSHTAHSGHEFSNLPPVLDTTPTALSVVLPTPAAPLPTLTLPCADTQRHGTTLSVTALCCDSNASYCLEHCADRCCRKHT